MESEEEEEREEYRVLDNNVAEEEEENEQDYSSLHGDDDEEFRTLDSSQRQQQQQIHLAGSLLDDEEIILQVSEQQSLSPSHLVNETQQIAKKLAQELASLEISTTSELNHLEILPLNHFADDEEIQEEEEEVEEQNLLLSPLISFDNNYNKEDYEESNILVNKPNDDQDKFLEEREQKSVSQRAYDDETIKNELVKDVLNKKLANGEESNEQDAQNSVLGHQLDEEYSSLLSPPNTRKSNVIDNNQHSKKRSLEEEEEKIIEPLFLGKQSYQNHSSYLRLSETDTFTISFSGHKVWYDEASQALILLRKGEFRAISLGTCPHHKFKPNEVFVRFRYDGSAWDVKISFCTKFVAIQRSDTTITMMSLPSNLETSIDCKGKGNTILRGGVVWIPSSNNGKSPPCICLVTRQGLETYTQKANSATFSNVSSIGIFGVRCFWCLSSRSVIVISTDDGEMRTFYLVKDSPYLEKWPKFQIEAPNPEQSDAALVDLYGEPWLIQIRQTQEMVLYRLGKDIVVKPRIISSFDGVTCGISFIDSLLIAHGQNTKVSLLYDVEDNLDRPFVHPLPLETAKVTHFGEEEEETEVDKQNAPIVPYSSTWVFLPPYWVLDARLGKVWKLELDIQSLIHSCSLEKSSERIAKFLLRRIEFEKEAKSVFFNYILSCSLQQDGKPNSFFELLPWLKVAAEHSEKLKNSSNMGTVLKNPFQLLLSQEEMNENVFKKMNINDPLSGSLVLEYIRYIYVNNDRVLPKEEIFQVVSKMLSNSKRSAELYQLCLFQIPVDSLPLSQTILFGKQDEEEEDKEVISISKERKQVGMDCLKRLNRSRDLVKLLLEEDQFLTACRYVQKQNLVQDNTILSLLFLKSDKNLDRLCMLFSLIYENRGEWLKQGGIRELGEQILMIIQNVNMNTSFGLM